ncbi:hypothetical protein BDV95DRAFT_497943 [Massariosphaeria phaeospora]|uniref:Uncharacterized protein n=1 Tax=Massariosphaeria phaeospora TaxID=100035 RepID=A0A7C8I8J5_9PLEO|nr:hypothetical protein BDV95DRAFT_497943 [Massariosphaeria phaeospora]
MRKSLHGHLKNGLDFERFEITPEDLVGDSPDEHHETQERATKRRRIEIIATQYLRGRTPTILSAGLKGPFGSGWRNPWTKEERTRKREGTRNKAPSRNASRARPLPEEAHHTTTKRRSSNRHITARDQRRRKPPGPSREKHQQSSEQHAEESPDLPDLSTKETCTSRKCSKESAPRQPLPHNLMASPTPASTSGFVYRKKGGTKVNRRAKPRLMTFDSSPAVTGEEHDVPEETKRDEAIIKHSGVHTNEMTEASNEGTGEKASPRPDIYEVVMANQIGQKSNASPGRNSDCSTQRAMMFAHMEFRDGTFPSTSTETPGPRLQAEGDTSLSVMGDQSPAITPFHTFNTEVDKRYPSDSLVGIEPISTQDLFTAATPFTFSTVKKKSVRPQRSNLRFAVLSHEALEEAADEKNTVKSPTPSAERVPLKERNSKLPFRSTASEKGSQEPSFAPHISSKNMELPQLDFHTSLDDVGSNRELAFTDRFLRNLDSMT